MVLRSSHSLPSTRNKRIHKTEYDCRLLHTHDIVGLNYFFPVTNRVHLLFGTRKRVRHRVMKLETRGFSQEEPLSLHKVLLDEKSSPIRFAEIIRHVLRSVG